MPNAPYLSEFTLTSEGTKKLQEFLDKHRRFLANYDDPLIRRAVKSELTKLVRQVMPGEVLAALDDVFAGTSDHVLAIHGFPEGSLSGEIPLSSDPHLSGILRLSERFYSHYPGLFRSNSIDA